MLGIALGAEVFSINRKKPVSAVVLLLGPPGAGKGTLAGPLSESLGLPHISTGDLFRENIRNGTPLGLEAKTHIDQGRLVPDELVLEMLFDRVGRNDCQLGYILDGFPRTLPQAQALDQRLQNRAHLIVLHFHVPDASLVERITGRLACKDCGRPFHKSFDPPKKEALCDRCGGALYQRDDDKEEILRKRLEVYHSQTAPLLTYYGKKEGLLKTIDARQAKETVLQETLAAIPFSPSSI